MTDTQEHTKEEAQEINRHFLKYLRENAQLTQEQLAEEMDVNEQIEDFYTAYFEHAKASLRVEWATKHLMLGQSLRVIPLHPKHEAPIKH